MQCLSSTFVCCVGVSVTSSTTDIRKAYLDKARESHPDRQKCGETTNGDFDEIRKAYDHLTTEGGNGEQYNPSHSLNLMLELSKTSVNHESETEGLKETDDFFKARLLAVLLEYGDKGLDLSNVRKKWTQVWPNVPFPDETSVVGQKRKGGLLEFLRRKAGGVVDIVALSNGKGSIRVIPKHFTQSHVERLHIERHGDSSQGTERSTY